MDRCAVDAQLPAHPGGWLAGFQGHRTAVCLSPSGAPPLQVSLASPLTPLLPHRDSSSVTEDGGLTLARPTLAGR